MCNGGGCPLQDSCYRYMAKPSELQTYFLTPPFQDDKCEMYWGEAAQSVYEQLKDIMKPANNGSENPPKAEIKQSSGKI